VPSRSTRTPAERWVREERRKVIMVRPETKPDDVHGMLAAEGILTSSGGRTSHAALVARQFGKPAVVGMAELEIDLEARTMTIGDTVIKEGQVISIDGTTGEVFAGEVRTVIPDIDNPHLSMLLGWADEIRTLGVRANADYPSDAERARKYGAEGLGLVRTEHMFFETERLPLVQAMIMARNATDRAEALDAPAAAAAQRLRRPVPRHGRAARHHPPHRPAAARVPAVARRPRPRAGGPEGAAAALPHHARDRRRADRAALQAGPSRARRPSCASRTRCSARAASASAS
jgi:phosphohistidine swiveling domain-containing protein